MISNHLIKDGNLILYINYNYEIGFFKNKKVSFENSITNYIKDHKIKFTGQILLVIGSILLATFNYDNNVLTLDKINKDENENIIYTMPFEDLNYIPEVKKNAENNNSSNNSKFNKNTSNSLNSSNNKTNNNKSNSNTNKSSSNNTSSNNKSAISNTSNTSEKNTNKVTIYRSNGKIITLDLEEYLIGVVAGEMPASFNIEALKAQAVLARTYALKAIKENKKLTDTTSTQVYIDNNEMKSKWGSDYNKYYSKIKQAVESTKSVYVTYNNELIDAVYHAISNGMTEDAINVWGHSIPYLKSVDSSYDKTVSGYSKSIIKTDSEILKIFGIDSLDNIEILSRNSSGRVSSVRVGDSTYTGVDIRTLLGLRSSDFDMEIVGENIKITTRGYGHGVGMSQYGANSMAKNGSTYEQIIKHYYSGVKINK